MSLAASLVVRRDLHSYYFPSPVSDGVRFSHGDYCCCSCSCLTEAVLKRDAPFRKRLPNMTPPLP